MAMYDVARMGGLPMTAMEDFLEQKELARIGFNAYREQAEGKTYDGKPIPEFDELSVIVQANWMSCARAIRDALRAKDEQ